MLAEASYNTEQYGITRKILDNYFQRVEQKDQFYCRAKLLHGLVIVNEAKSKNGAECLKYRKIALNEMMESLNVATSPENSHRYSYIVHNTSIFVWKIIQPFLRTGRAKNFINEIQRVSAALETIDDSDKDWRIMYLCATSYCLNDDNQNKLASDMLDKGIEHAEGMLKLVVDDEAIIAEEISKYSSETEQIISALRQVEERDSSVAKKERLKMLQQMLCRKGKLLGKRKKIQILHESRNYPAELRKILMMNYES